MRGDYLTRCPLCRRDIGQEDSCADCGRCIDCVVGEGHGQEEHPEMRLRTIKGGEDG